MRINAYVLAADPTWIEASVGAYYPLVGNIIVSFDAEGRGWTGAPIALQECLARLKSIDVEGKMRFVPGCFSRPAADPMENDTLQRNAALREAEKGADWVLQLDTDEWLPDPGCLVRVLREAEKLGVNAVEWPMRVLYRQLPGGGVLEVCSHGGKDHFEFIAPIAVRSGTVLTHSRRCAGRFLRATVIGDAESIQLHREALPEEVRVALLKSGETIVHNSWARSPSELQRKLASWSHASLRAWWYYAFRWLPSVWLWRGMRNLHPYFGGVWPALRKCGLEVPPLQSPRLVLPV